MSDRWEEPVKITAITTVGACYGRSNFVFVRVDTDEGISGVGECTLESKELSVIAAVEECKRILIGRSPLEIERNWLWVYRHAPWKGAVLYTAMSGLEQAMWDIAGKAYGQPVYRLLGGPVRDSIRAYTWPDAFTSPEHLADNMQAAREQYGYRDFKFGLFHGRFTVEAEELANARRYLTVLRERLGDGIGLAVDASRRFYPPAALQIARTLEPFDILFLEEPCESGEGHEDALAYVRSKVNVPLATGEHEFTRRRFWHLIKNQLVDVLQPDLCHAGGILETRKIAAMAETVGITIVPHNPNGPVGLAATVQFAACTPNFWMTETVHTRNPIAHRFVVEPMRVVDGVIELPTKPGLGVELDWDAIAAHPLVPKEFALTAPKIAV